MSRNYPIGPHPHEERHFKHTLLPIPAADYARLEALAAQWRTDVQGALAKMLDEYLVEAEQR